MSRRLYVRVLPLTTRLSPLAQRIVRIAIMLVGAILIITAANALTGIGGSALTGPIRDWLSSVLYVLVAVIVTVRAARTRSHRLAWGVFAAGVSLYALGNVLWAGWFEHMRSPPIPSVCDPLWLSLYPASYVAIVRLARDHRRDRIPAGVWMDGIVAGLGLAGLSAAAVFGPILASVNGATLAMGTELAYPICDLLLAALVVGMLSLRGWRLGRASGSLAAGFMILALGDSLYALEVAQGSSLPSSIANLVWVFGFALLAVAAWQPERAPSIPQLDRWSVLVVPAGFAVSALALLFYDRLHRINLLAFSLAIATLLTAIVRLALTFRDVRALAEARHQATTDELTALPNRRLFKERVSEAIADARSTDRVSILLMDLDRFKELNDTLGHDAGDALLSMIGPRLEQVLRATDTVARLGGDEFAILLNSRHNEGSVTAVSTMLLDALLEPFDVRGLALRVSASLGISTFPQDGADVDELLKSADVAMYLAKAAGTRVEFYSHDRDTNSRERLMLTSELAGALESGELELWYQPKALTESRRIVGVEALVRWRRADGTLLLPGQFVGVAEHAGLSRALTRTVLGSAVSQLGRWRADGLELQMAVNTTVADLLDLDFPNEVAAALLAHRVPPSALIIEVTEQSLLSDPVRIATVLAELSRIGVQLSLDDFGTGYSSLTHLKTLPVSEIKIDRSFVSRMCEDDTDAAIVFATIALAHKLGVRVVAEGVEDEQTWQQLAELGCELIQGYALGRPVPARELEERLRAALRGPSSGLATADRDRCEAADLTPLGGVGVAGGTPAQA